MSGAILTTTTSHHPSDESKLEWAAVLALVRKELHESWSALLLGCFIVGGITALGLQSRIFEDTAVIVSALFGGAIMFPLMVAMGVVAPERAEGSIQTLLRLPMPPWVVLALKTAVAVVITLTPMALSLVVARQIAGDREVEPALFYALYASAALVALNLLIWTVSVGIDQPSEARVGMVGIALLVLLMLIAGIAESLFTNQTLHSVLPWTPFGFIEALQGSVPPRRERIPDKLMATAWRQIVVLGVVWLFAAWRFSRPGRTRG